LLEEPNEDRVRKLIAYQQSAHMALLWYKQALLSLFTPPGGGWWPTNPFLLNAFSPKSPTEAEARTLLWRSRFQGKEFHCPHCHAEQFYPLATRPEVRTCKGCRRQLRLRAGTIFESSKTSLLLWVKALFYVMQGKRGISAQELQRHLGLKSYG
jgi:transposase-like protein